MITPTIVYTIQKHPVFTGFHSSPRLRRGSPRSRFGTQTPSVLAPTFAFLCREQRRYLESDTRNRKPDLDPVLVDDRCRNHKGGRDSCKPPPHDRVAGVDDPFPLVGRACDDGLLLAA